MTVHKERLMVDPQTGQVFTEAGEPLTIEQMKANLVADGIVNPDGSLNPEKLPKPVQEFFDRIIEPDKLDVSGLPQEHRNQLIQAISMLRKANETGWGDRFLVMAMEKDDREVLLKALKERHEKRDAIESAEEAKGWTDVVVGVPGLAFQTEGQRVEYKSGQRLRIKDKELAEALIDFNYVLRYPVIGLASLEDVEQMETF